MTIVHEVNGAISRVHVAHVKLKCWTNCSATIPTVTETVELRCSADLVRQNKEIF